MFLSWRVLHTDYVLLLPGKYRMTLGTLGMLTSEAQGFATMAYSAVNASRIAVYQRMWGNVVSD
jgi:hypothetical protein